MAEYSSNDFGLIIEVDKVGGGTLGKHYTGDWEVKISQNDTVLLDDVITVSGEAKTHVQMAASALDFVDDVDMPGEDEEYIPHPQVWPNYIDNPRGY